MWIQLSHILGLACLVAAASPKVKIGKTTITGRDITSLKLDFFGGIPFAQPPLGSLRLQPPVLQTHLKDTTFDATNFGKACLQPHGDLTTLSEDCLTLNIYRPAGISANAKLPVLFWTFGGGFVGGTSSTYNASAIVAQSVARGTPVIYVSFNYRLGPLGYPQGQESADRGALNLALKDQIAALQWVQANIGSFGGDKKKVTVFGQSAGAIMTAILFLNNNIKDLARAAIFESGSAASPVEFPAAHRQINWQNFVAGVPSCASLATASKTYDCLRKASTEDIFTGLKTAIAELTELYGFNPTIDGAGGLLPDLASTLLLVGKFSKLPFIAGTNLDEGTIFTPQISFTSEMIYGTLVQTWSGSRVGAAALADNAAELLKLYPDDPALGSPYNTGNETFGIPGFKRTAAIQGDIAFQSQRRSWIQTASRFGVNTWGYHFTQPQPNGPAIDGVPHGSEVPFVYGAPPDTSASARLLSTQMIDYWVSFATCLDPNDKKGVVPRPNWPRYTPTNQVLIQLNAANLTTIPDTYHKEQIDFINSNPAAYQHRRGLTKVRVPN